MNPKINKINYLSIETKLVFVFFIGTFFISCSKVDEQKGIPIARAFDRYLYTSELQGLIPQDISKEDSITFVEQYANNWLREETILKQAELNLSQDQKSFEEKLNKYKNSLVIYAYESQLVQQKLDTSITELDIENYYNTNKDNFLLKDYIVKVLYARFEKNAPDLGKVENWMGEKSSENRVKLNEHCAKYASNFYLEDDVWLYFDDMLKEVPLKVMDKESFLLSNKFVKIEKENFVYFLKVIEYKLKDGLSPLSIEKENIKNILINQRKIKLIGIMREGIFKDALQNKNIEIF
jgi:hypothetical protein